MPQPHIRIGAQDRISAQEAVIQHYNTETRQGAIRDNFTSIQNSARVSQRDSNRRLNWESENPQAVMSTHIQELKRDQKAGMPPVDARFNMSVALLKDNKVPAIFDSENWNDLEDKNQARGLFDEYVNDARNYTACHDVASELVNIFGDNPGQPGQVFSGTGDDRAQGIKAAQDALKPGQPSVIQVKHKDLSGDGHSFVLFNTGNKDNEIQSTEAWAVASRGSPPPMNQRADLYAQLSRDMLNIKGNEAMAALDDLSSENPDARDRGLRVLSKFGGRAAFEKPQQDYNSLETTISIKPLATPNEVQDRFRERQDTLNQMVNSLS